MRRAPSCWPPLPLPEVTGFPGITPPGADSRSPARSAHVPGELIGGADDRLAGERLRLDLLARDRRAAERGGLQLALDLPGEPVPDEHEDGQCLVGDLVDRVAAALALDGLRRRLERRGAEIADTGVDLLVALAECGHAGGAERGAWIGQDLGDDPAVVLVVIL